MCGIAGYLVHSYAEDMSPILKGMADVISHRGPDDDGFFETRTKSSGHHVGLAHRRLSIIDLGTGHQPIANEDGSVQLVFNGEIYNY
ncbi:MAG TPA: asparagine synthetase B, partial [Gammaproteobacteria bacterium]|nr:asparagine synthetase B [Gammaproteobacteria bacterium]